MSCSDTRCKFVAETTMTDGHVAVLFALTVWAGPWGVLPLAPTWRERRRLVMWGPRSKGAASLHCMRHA